MSEVQQETQEATQLKAQYAAQVAADLERNTKEQDRIGAELTALQGQLEALQQDQVLLASVQQALGGASSAAAVQEAAAQAAAVPAPRSAPAAAKPARGRKAAAPKPKAKKATAKKTTAKKAVSPKTDSQKTDGGQKTAGEKAVDEKTVGGGAVSKEAAPVKAAVEKAPAEKAAGKPERAAAAQPTLGTLIHGHLSKQSEPRSAAEVATALVQAHPERGIKTTVVRTTLEGLVAKGRVERTKQGTSVFYTVTGSAAGASAPQDSGE
jgi:hypothetical protein